MKRKAAISAEALMSENANPGSSNLNNVQYSRCHDEPSSSHCNYPAAAPQLELSRLQAQLVEREQQLEQQRSEAETFLRELQESVMCPVGSWKNILSITENCVSQVAATIIQWIQHPCV